MNESTTSNKRGYVVHNMVIRWYQKLWTLLHT